jgi:hypothetical protein
MTFREKRATEDEVIYQMLLRWGGGWTTEEMMAGLKDSEAMEVFTLAVRPLFPMFALRARLRRLRKKGKVVSSRLTPKVVEWTAVPEELPVPDSTLVAKQVPKEPQ